ncbi:type III secretion system inner membrane ring lipoprotein SctJ [uncultured Aureimonas sp.]|uniref:type III secretion system inner membrane ring lipoprotein SctJ n=1 Tax=uncultured Aureimonas sp. TaxID=1604662 RepID=UPI0025EED8B3|nr:type III secretion inner membrane ring lipoprotein SctJ [uncultured Aureimonas sp.]
MKGRSGAVRRSLRAGAALGLALLLSGCKTDLYTNLTEYEANQMLAVMMANGIPADKAALGEAFTVRVEKDDMLRAIALLNDKGYPRNTRESIGKIFEKSGIISSPFEERVRYIYALGEEVAQTLSQIDGVVSARVHIVLPEEPQLGQPVRPSSAAVFIKHEPNVDLDFFVPQIRRLVSSAIQGLDYAAVAVVLTEAAPTEVAPLQTETRMVSVLPGLSVPEADAGGVRMMVYALAGTLLLLLTGSVAGLVYFLRGRRRTVRAAPAVDPGNALMEPS